MWPAEWLRALVALVLVLVTGLCAAQDRTPLECFAEHGLSAPRAADGTVVLHDASTYLTESQRQQAGELILSELRPGRSVTVYGFARGAGQEALQRLAHFELPQPLDAPWSVSGDRQREVNACIHDRSARLRLHAGKVLDRLLGDYVAAPDGESAIAQAVTAAVANHRGATRFVVISDGMQHQRDFTFYDMRNHPGRQGLRKFEPQAQAQALLKLGAPAFTRAIQVIMFPVGQPEPAPAGQPAIRRRAEDLSALLAAWQTYYARAGAGRVVVTTFVPME